MRNRTSHRTTAKQPNCTKNDHAEARRGDQTLQRTEEKLVKNEVGLVKVEDEIEFADVAKVLVKHFHKVVDDLEVHQLVVIIVHKRHKVERRIPGAMSSTAHVRGTNLSR